MKLIEDWKQAWKLKSVQVGAMSAPNTCTITYFNVPKALKILYYNKNDVP